MRKAERLFQLLTLLRSRRQVMTATQIAEALEVSERTIYRDVQALLLSGVPIEGEAGVGYRLRPGFTLPPLMFEEDELEAIRFGVRMVQGWSGTKMARAANRAFQKIEAILPEQTHWELANQVETIVVADHHRESMSQYSDDLHEAIKRQVKLELKYQSEKQEYTQRQVWPLGLIYWGKTWTLVAWCELRNDYRMFRLDRILAIILTDVGFQTSDAINLKHYIDQQIQEHL